MTVYEVVIEGRQGLNDMLTVLHYDQTAGPAIDWDDIASIIKGHLSDHIAPICSNRVTWEGITYREDAPGAVGTFLAFPTGLLTGTDVSGDQADVLTMLVRKQSAGLVRPTRGWILQGGVSANNLTGNGIWEQAIMDEVEAYAEDLRVINAAFDVTLQMVIKASNPTAPNTQAYSPVASVTVERTPRALKTRFPGSGS